ncbi:MAG TPA: winged helix-turn-helix transcriptional regulator, partial [Thermoplasmata archaeon]|nr:winged helix-turn-helix transcriptional regulator [Thermoplasmata archaeon]
MPGHGSRVLGRMPDIDLDIFRELYGGGGVTSFGVDPRINASVIARRLSVSRARVAARLAEWKRIGLIRRYDVWPNPALFGLDIATVDIRVNDRLRKGALYEKLGLIDGLVGGVDLLGEWSSVQLFAGTPGEMARRVELIRGLADVVEVSAPVPLARLEPEHPLTPLDLRIVRVLRRYPTASLAAVARHVGVSARTITTRYARLLDDHSVWFVPVLDFRSLPMPVLSVQVTLDDPSDRASVAKGVRRAYPQALEFLRNSAEPPGADR